MKKFIIAMLTYFCATASQATTISQHNVEINRIYTGYKTGEDYFSIINEVVNPSGCQNTVGSHRLYSLNPDDNDMSSALTSLVAAKSLGVTIDLQLFKDSCYSGYVKVRRIAF
ncbi:hypothetical protein GCM10023333_06160 [Ferrimonas pelagia]|uniref:Uncharacterized protein n=1 Tax=Ferrimonas pelagia TaxID=1177826 RepID=A0ABP9EDK6_9GAMM